MARRQRNLAISYNGGRLARLAFKGELRHVKISGLRSVVVLPGVRTVLAEAFGDRAKTARLQRSGEVVNLRTRRLFSTAALFIKIELHASGRDLRFDIAAEIGVRFLRCFRRANYVTKGNVGNNHARVDSGLRLAFNVTYHDQRYRRPRPFYAMLGPRPANGRAMAKEILGRVAKA